MARSDFSLDAAADRAWLDFRIALADRLLASTETIDIETPAGKTLSVEWSEDHVVVLVADTVTSFANVDAAALFVQKTLRHRWGVIHPHFLDTDLIEKAHVRDEEHVKVFPNAGTAATADELFEWIVAVYNEGRDEPIRVSSNRRVRWDIDRDEPLVVRAANTVRVEFSYVLARQVGFTKAHRVIDQLSKEYVGLKFTLHQDTLVMTQVLVAEPFVPDHLWKIHRSFGRYARELDWVQERVLRKRAKVDREELHNLREALDAANDTIATLSEELEEERRKIQDVQRQVRDQRRTVMMMRRAMIRTEQERDDALETLERVREAVGGGAEAPVHFSTCQGMGLPLRSAEWSDRVG